MHGTRKLTFLGHHVMPFVPVGARLLLELVFELMDRRRSIPRAFLLLLTILTNSTPSCEEDASRGISNRMEELDNVEPS